MVHSVLFETHYSLPKYLSDIESLKTVKFKFEIYKFLELIPEELKMQNYVTAARSNSIVNPPSHRRAQGIYNSGGVFERLGNSSKYSK